MAKNYTYTDLSVKNSLTLEVEGVGEFEVTQFSSSWAANEIPTAAVMLAVGRNARTQDHAKIHSAGDQLKQMQKAYVWFEPRGEYDRGVDWPGGGRRKIFEGYFTGFAYRKISGKVHVVGNLIHWLAALGFSSCLTEQGHVSNPTAMNAAAVLRSLASTGGGLGNYVSMLVPMQLCAAEVKQDLWRGMKKIFCALADLKTMPPAGTQGSCGGDGTASANDAAQYALAKIEGTAVNCNVPYKWGVPLVLDTLGVPIVEDAVAAAIGNEVIESYSAVSMWDKLTAQLMPMFGMAIVPRVDTAVVVADCPAYNADVWRDVTVDDQDSFDLTRELHRPLRAVGVVAGYASQTKAGVQQQPSANGPPDGNYPVVGGCYASSSVTDGDGMYLYVAAPPWLQMLNTMPVYVSGTQGVGKEAPSPSSTTPGVAGKPSATPPGDGTVGIAVNKLYARYAHEVFVNQMLRGQACAFSGKLRFDVAPLSIVRVKATTEKFIGQGQDDLAETIVGCVQRVTIAINAEAGMAGTSFQLSHVRTETENKLPRTSAEEHPLFGKSIHGGGKHGCPLVDDFEFPNPPAVAPPPRPV